MLALLKYFYRMKIRSLGAFTTVLCTMSMSLCAQQNDAISYTCHQQKNIQQTLAKPTIADPAENDYDVKNVVMNLNVSNLSRYVVGDVTTTARVTVASMNSYVFELNKNLIIDSVKINGQKLTVSSNNDVRTVALATPLSQNNLFAARVYYRGTSSGTGIKHDTSQSWGTIATYTLSEPYGAKDWWPCKQALTDKIDSTTIRLTVADSLKAGANDVLKSVTALPNNLARYEWKSNIPIDYYLISFAVAPYTDYSFYVKFNNSNDSMLVQNYVYGDNPQVLPYWKKSIDSVRQMLTYFSDIVGRYPFWKEKYGHCMAPMGGGMEHQTMTSQGNFGTLLSAHELFHQWFGDNVTCATWADIWLNEGFASYGEYLYIEKYWGAAEVLKKIKSKHSNVLSKLTGTVYVNDTTIVSRIFDSRLTYDKGASVVHMLRFWVGNDSVFFAMLRDYQQFFKGGTATTTQFKNRAGQFLQRNLDTFINQWIYNEGYPVFDATWNQTDSTVVIKLNQAVTTGATVSLFHTPIELKLTSAQGDTVVRVHQSKATQSYVVNWKKTMTGMVIDPEEKLLRIDQGAIKDITLTGIKTLDEETPTIYPNPTNTTWSISPIPLYTTLQVYDISGRMLKRIQANQSTATIDATQFPAGMYYLITTNHQQSHTFKLIKQ